VPNPTTRAGSSDNPLRTNRLTLREWITVAPRPHEQTPQIEPIDKKYKVLYA
jgi:hypothetical protein